MTLRLRLVLGLLTLLAVGLVAFGLATGTLYARSQNDSLDSQMRSSEDFVACNVESASCQSGLGGSSTGPVGGTPGERKPTGKRPSGTRPAGTRPSGTATGNTSPTDGEIVPSNRPNGPVPSGTYGVLLSKSGKVLRIWKGDGPTTRTAKLPKSVKATPGGTFMTVGATSGSTKYRLLATQMVNGTGGTDGDIVVMITPMTNVVSSITNLVLIETIGGLVLLILVSVGAWTVLRRELRPLERMARSARTITAGDLSQRVSTAGPTEVGELGLALNTMLGDIESAFRDREATELRLRQFLADASHELRTPLTSIQGFAELFRVGGAQAQVDLPTILRRIEQEAHRMSLLVEDLLMLARLDQSRPIERLPVDLSVLAADACTDLVALAPERTIKLDAPEPVMVRGDQHHLRQALTNLAMNAVRHTPEGTPIEVSARREGRVAIVAVRDHGPGLTDAAKAKVFDRFWQADQARVGPGVGLGLAIVAGIAAEHGGKAAAENAPDGGAVFELRLPLPA